MEYKEKLEEARKLYPTANADQRYVLESLFPELKSEDEKIRKELIAFIKTRDRSGCDYDYDKWIAWLEKQGNKETLCDKCRKEQPSHSCQDITANGRCYIEGMNTSNNVKPKFKVGDWVVNNTTKDVFLIKSVNSGYCTLEDIKGNIISPCLPQCESESHLWAIQDAKDGDVLANCNIICIYKKRESEHLIKVYLNYSIAEGVEVTDDTIGDFNLYPATKEVRDILFAKMKEAGYEWNAEKKEVNKIEQKPVIDINIPFGAKDSELIEASYHIPEGFHAEIEGNNVVIKKGEQKPATIDIDKMVNHYANTKERGNEKFGLPLNCMIRAYRQGICDTLEKKGENKLINWRVDRFYEELNNPYND